MPKRLGGPVETGVAASQWQRLANDLASVANLRTIAVITYDCEAPPSVVSYSGCHGTGVSVAPSISRVSAGVVDLEWEQVYTDPHGTARELVIMHAEVQGQTYGGATLTNEGVVTPQYGGVASALRIECHNAAGSAADGRVTVEVLGMFGAPSAHTDYGGDVDKRDCGTETTPYAATWYGEYTAMLGSAFSQETSGYIHAVKLALARLAAAESRDAERFSCNAMPTLSDNMSRAWCETIKIPYVDSMSGAMRRKLLATRIAAASGPSQDSVDAAVASMLGTNLVEVHRYLSNDLDDPPVVTRWPFGLPGSPALNIGGGAWISQRAHVFVEVEHPNIVDSSSYRELLDVHLSRLLDTILPAHATFDWGATIEGGFIIGESLLGVNAL